MSVESQVKSLGNGLEDVS